MTTAIDASPQKRLTRLQLRSAPMIALGLLLSALIGIGLPIVLLAAIGGEKMTARMLAGLAMLALLGAGPQAVMFGPALWILHRRPLASSGRRWFILTGLVVESLLALVYVLLSTHRNAHSAANLIATAVVLALGGALFGGLGGLVFSLTATRRRAPLEALFE